MRLASVTIVNVAPFGELTISFRDEQDAPRPVTVLLGSGGVGKTTLLTTLSATRPGCAVALSARAGAATPQVTCEWILGNDDPSRPHALCVATPTARVHLDEQAEMMRRREQVLYDKVARDGGFAFLFIPSTRWFSRQPIAFSAPDRTIARYDIRALAAPEDASRSDLARETKQALAYAAIAQALGERSETGVDFSLLGRGMRTAVDRMVAIAGFRYAGVDPASFEPVFVAENGHQVPFDGLPTRARHLVALAALPVRTLWAAYPGADPLRSEGVIAVDEVELHQDLGVHGLLVETLRAALPCVQWVLTATSPLVTSRLGEREIFALRRLPDERHVELFTGAHARLH